MAWKRLPKGPVFFVRCAAIVFLLGGLVFIGRGGVSAPPETSKPAITDPKEALASFNELIGEWRGVGQPRRGSNVGAWFETAEWVWDFEEKIPAIRYDVKKGQLLKTARLSWDAEEQKFRLKAVLPDDTTREYAGRLDESNKLILESAPDPAGVRHRMTVRQLNENRTLVLHEKRTGQGVFTRIAEVGYTRQGTSLAVEGTGDLECIVTGGKGTIAVSYEGKTYYVCCTGCQQAFEDDPAGIIAAYEKKRADRKAKQGK